MRGHTSGVVYAAGDTDYEFSIQSVSKPFVFALICQAIGEDEARAKLGVNSTGLPFNSVIAVERADDGTTNPMVNAGAIAASSLAPGATADENGNLFVTGSPDLPEKISDSTARFMIPKQPPTSETEVSPACFRATIGSTSTLSRLPMSIPNSVAERKCQRPGRNGCTLANGGVNPLQTAGH